MKKSHNTRVRHWDGLGHPILGMYEMWDYFRTDGASLDVVKRYLPHNYKIIPTVTISFDKSEPSVWKVDCVYPGGSTSKILFVGKRAMSWARDVWAGRNLAWGKSQIGTTFLLKRFCYALPIKPYPTDEKYTIAERS